MTEQSTDGADRCNRCGDGEQVAGWGVCSECFRGDCLRLARSIEAGTACDGGDDDT